MYLSGNLRWVPLNLHKDLPKHSTHCMEIILKRGFQFSHCVMKNVLFPTVTTIFKLIYLCWFKMKQTLPGFCVTRFTSAVASASFSARFPGLVLLCYLAETISSFQDTFNAS